MSNLKARIVLAIYDDHTAEVEDERAFEAILAKRVATARAFAISAQIFRDASVDEAPTDRAERDFDSATTGSTKAVAQFLEADKAQLNRAPKDKKSARAFMGAQADYYSARAAAWNGDYANVRRLN